MSAADDPRIAYAALSMGCRAVEQGSPLTRCKKGELRRQWSLFKEGLQYFIEQLANASIRNSILSQIDDYVENCALTSYSEAGALCSRMLAA